MSAFHQAATPHVLAVEDDEAVQRAIARALAGSFRVDFAGTGAAGLERLAAGHTLPGFVLLDFRLPDMDGLQVLSRLRQQAHTRHLPVVMFSSMNNERLLAQAREAGADSWVVKPDDPHVFRECILAICRYWLHWNVIPPRVLAK